MDGPKAVAAKAPSVARAFEPNRLARQFLAGAYQSLVPVIRRPLLPQARNNDAPVRTRAKGACA
jgi:hypothetical protein